MDNNNQTPNQDPYQNQQQPQHPYYSPENEQNTAYNAPIPGRNKAIASLVCGIASVALLWFGWSLIISLGLGIVAIILGAAARKELPVGQTGMATAGFILGIIGTVLGAVFCIACIACVGMVGLGAGGFFDAMGDMGYYFY